MTDRIRIAVIGGSVRPANYTSRAARLVTEELETLGAEATWVDPAVLSLAAPGAPPTPDALALRETVERAVGVVLATPEYHGSYSSVMKQVIENLGFPSALAGKPVALLGVASGAIGAVKALEHLHGVVAHVGALALPGQVSVAGVQRVFDEAGACLDPAVEARVRGLGRSLLDYIHGHICPRIALESMARQAA